MYKLSFFHFAPLNHGEKIPSIMPGQLLSPSRALGPQVPKADLYGEGRVVSLPCNIYFLILGKGPSGLGQLLQSPNWVRLVTHRLLITRLAYSQQYCPNSSSESPGVLSGLLTIDMQQCRSRAKGSVQCRRVLDLSGTRLWALV